MSKFTIKCDKCSAETEFTRYDVPELDDYIDREIADAEAEAQEDARDEFAGFIDPRTALRDELFELSAAIRRGDQAEAKLYLDKVAYALGTEFIERVERGWFSIRPARAA